MKLPFRYQFILAPFLIIVLLAALVIYTLYELSNINRENENTRHWEILTDQIQSAITTANKLEKIIENKSVLRELEENEQFFAYLEQSRILFAILFDSFLLDNVSSELNQELLARKGHLQEQDGVDPLVMRKILDSLVPKLDYQYKLFSAHRRTATINNHRALVAISSRLSVVLLTVLIFCILLAAAISLWGLAVTRNRLKNLAKRINTVCSNNDSTRTGNGRSDELDDLEFCLSVVTQRLLKVVSVENALRGAENERRRIAMDMHDGVLAELTAANRNIDNLQNQFSQDKNKRQLLMNMRGDIDEAIKNLRRTIDDLHPQVLETLGLDAALKSYMERYGKYPHFPKYHYDFDERIESKISNETKLGLFRIISEVIHNIIKHANGSSFEVSLRIVNDKLCVTVDDNGVGIKDVQPVKGHGRANISERASVLGASVRWRASRFATGTGFELILALE